MKLLSIVIAFIWLFMNGELAAAKQGGTDYHTHMQSPAFGKIIAGFCGVLAECDPEELVNGTDTEKFIEQFKESPIRNAVILSSAYLAGMPEAGLDEETQKTLTRDENIFVSKIISTAQNMYGFFSVNPVASYALDEARYWVNHKGFKGFKGIKLHFASSNIDLNNPDHIKQIKELMRLVDHEDMTVMVHLRTRSPSYGAKDVQIFINEIMPQIKKAEIIIAHAAGWGGYDEATHEALSTFIKAIQSGMIDRDQIYFDISAVITDELPTDRKFLFLKMFRKLEITNWLFGSDWSPGFYNVNSNHYYETLSKDTLTPEELDDLLSNNLEFVN